MVVPLPYSLYFYGLYMEKLYTIVFMFNDGLFAKLSAVIFVFALSKDEAEIKAKGKMDDQLSSSSVKSSYQIIQVVQVDDCLIVEAYNNIKRTFAFYDELEDYALG